MKCPKCHYKNPANTRFCGDCGAKLRPDKKVTTSLTKTLKIPMKALTRGSTFAKKYEVIEELGIGGMGVVYKAKDTKLKRTVALKFLSPELTRNKEAKERFVHEAQAASALDHPNICTIHEIDESKKQMFIAMAYIDGQSLNEKIKQRPLKLEKALDIAMQVASGLQEAHEKKIVHRDIKSANIMVAAKGQAKIMDFGVAKLAGQTKFTKTGTTIGTIAYMSPEQAHGEKVDFRTDIWSLGVVLYEMVTGQLPFKGDHEQAVVYSILNEEPEPITGLRTGVPMELERIVNKALAKKMNERYQHADDLLVDLRILRNKLPDLIRSSEIVRPLPFTRQPWQLQRKLLWKILAGTISVIAIIILLSVWLPRRPPQGPVSRFAINLPQGETLVGPGSAVALSHDGKQVVYVSKQGNTTQLYLRPIDEFEAKPISGTVGAKAPFFSPDDKWVGFFADDKLKKVSLLGGSPQDICKADYFGGSWGSDDTIVFADVSKKGLWQVPSVGGKPEQLTTWKKLSKKRLAGGHVFPQILPGGKAILYTVIGKFERDFQIAVHSIEKGEQKVIIEQGSHARYLPTGHLVYSLAGDLMAVRFDLKKLEITGTPIPLLEGVQMGQEGTAHFSVSENGVLGYIPGGALIPPGMLIWMERTGKIEPLRRSAISSYQPRISPDGINLVFQNAEGGLPSLWLYELKRGTLRRFTDDKSAEQWPLWTLDGRQIVFNSNLYGGEWANLYWKPADGSGQAERLTYGNYHQQAQSWTPDGKELAFTQGNDPKNLDIWILPFDGNWTPRPLIQTRFSEFHPSFSPDGRWLAYTSNETGRWEVYVRPYPGPGSATQVSTNGGAEPVWAPDGRELFYRVLSGNKMMAISIVTEPTFRVVGKPTLLFEGNYYPCSAFGRSYDLTSDGRRFLLIAGSRQQSLPTQYNIVLNWFEELKRLVP